MAACSSLQAVSAGGYKAVVWLFLEKDVDANIQGVDNSASATTGLGSAMGCQIS